MSKKSCEAAESIEDAVHDNRMFAERAFYCIANGAGELFFRRFILCVDPLQICIHKHINVTI